MKLLFKGGKVVSGKGTKKMDIPWERTWNLRMQISSM